MFRFIFNELACCMESSVDPDQLASLEASLYVSTLFSVEYVSGFILFSKALMYDTAQK